MIAIVATYLHKPNRSRPNRPERLAASSPRKALLLCKIMLCMCLATNVAATTDPIKLWPGVAPGSEAWRQVEVETDDFTPHRVVRNVVTPTLTPFLADADENTGIAVIVAPGGGFKFLSIETEGIQVAQWLQQRGINAFVLKYRLDETAANSTLFKLQAGWMLFGAWMAGDEDNPEIVPSPVRALAIADALQAIAIVREQAGRWAIRPNAIGMIGFSAGGAVATGAAIEGRGLQRPDFVASIYGVPDRGDVPHNAPPLYIAATEDDPLIPMSLSEELNERWLQQGYSSTLVRYPDGGHGFGMQQKGTSADNWIEAFHRWVLSQADE